MALSSFSPAVVPSVQLPTAATPAASVTTVAPVTLPPPDTTTKVTVTLRTPWPAELVTFTAGDVGTGVATVAVCPWPANLSRFAATGSVSGPVDPPHATVSTHTQDVAHQGSLLYAAAPVLGNSSFGAPSNRSLNVPTTSPNHPMASLRVGDARKLVPSL